MTSGFDLAEVDWDKVLSDVISRGWSRLERVIAPEELAALEHAAPGPWNTLPETEGGAGVRQAGLACHSAVDEAAEVVQLLAHGVCAGLDGVAASGVSAVPAFNHVQWCRADRGQKYITAHRDPDTAGGVIAVLTIRGRAVFRVWGLDDSGPDAGGGPRHVHEWESVDGDIVLMCGAGWPLAASRCPIHEAESPVGGDRVTLTLRHNNGGYGSDYFV